MAVSCNRQGRPAVGLRDKRFRGMGDIPSGWSFQQDEGGRAGAGRRRKGGSQRKPDLELRELLSQETWVLVSDLVLAALTVSVSLLTSLGLSSLAVKGVGWVRDLQTPSRVHIYDFPVFLTWNTWVTQMMRI